MRSLRSGSGIHHLNSMRQSPVWMEDFGTSSAVQPFVMSAIASGSWNSPTSGRDNANHPGALRIISAAGANSGIRINLDTVAFLIGGGEFAEAVIYFEQLTAITMRLGFHDSASSADATDGVYLEVPNGGNIVGKTSNNSTRSTTGTGYTLVAGNWYRLRLQVNDDATSVSYYVYDKDGVQLWTDTLAANIPTAAGRECAPGFTFTYATAAVVDPLAQLDWLAFCYDRVLRR